MDNIEPLISEAVKLATHYTPKLILAILTLYIGLKVIKGFKSLLRKRLESQQVDQALQSFLPSLIDAFLKVALAISVAGMVGIEMTSFIAVLGAAGLAVGMALSGTLQNFAGGVMILLFKPFKVGDYVEAQGYSGSINEIQIFHTILKTPDNKTIILANAPLSTGTIVNYSTETRRRVDFTFGIGYGDDIDHAKAILNDIITKDGRVHKDPAPFIAVSELADSSVNLVVRAWVNASDYWGVYFDTIEIVKKRFDQENISIPFPQRDVHIHQVEK